VSSRSVGEAGRGSRGLGGGAGTRATRDTRAATDRAPPGVSRGPQMIHIVRKRERNVGTRYARHRRTRPRCRRGRGQLSCGCRCSFRHESGMLDTARRHRSSQHPLRVRTHKQHVVTAAIEPRIKSQLQTTTLVLASEFRDVRVLPRPTRRDAPRPWQQHARRDRPISLITKLSHQQPRSSRQVLRPRLPTQCDP